MKETPILFTSQMVQALLAGRKTQTRRVVKPQLPKRNWTRVEVYAEVRGLNQRVGNEDYWIKPGPYGVPGDRLWVRETFKGAWKPGDNNSDEYWITYRADNQKAFYRRAYLNLFENWPDKWRPSIFMPRWASRITLTVVNVRVERVRDITNDDAQAEGVEPIGWLGNSRLDDYRTPFKKLWNSINAKPRPIKVDGQVAAYECFPWDDSHPICQKKEWRGKPLLVTPNPWVWAVEFRKLESACVCDKGGANNLRNCKCVVLSPPSPGEVKGAGSPNLIVLDG